MGLLMEETKGWQANAASPDFLLYAKKGDARAYAFIKDGQVVYIEDVSDEIMPVINVSEVGNLEKIIEALKRSGWDIEVPRQEDLRWNSIRENSK